MKRKAFEKIQGSFCIVIKGSTVFDDESVEH